MIDIKSNNGTYINLTYFTKGGMGEIYKAVEKNSGEEVIVKFIRIFSDELKDLQKREIDISIEFNHKNIVRTRDVGEAILENGEKCFYIVQDFYKNGNLRNVIRSPKTFDIWYSQIIDILYGMKEIHKRIVHRDLKPENTLIDDDGHLRISDFGLSKYIEDATQTKTFKGKGTLPYMAPECWKGEKNTPAMDIYSLGIMFFEIITGNLPMELFRTEDEFRNWHRFELMPSISKHRNDIPLKVNQIIQKMTQKSVNDRYASIDEVIAEFESVENIIRNGQTENSSLAAIAQMADFSDQRKTQEKLALEKKRQEEIEFKNTLDFSVKNLYSDIQNKIETVNSSLSQTKIEFRIANHHDKPDSLFVSYDKNNFSVNFLRYDAIKKHEETAKQRFFNNQKQMHGMVLIDYNGSFFAKENIVLAGLMETGRAVGEVEYGMNLVLVKGENEDYGTWHKITLEKHISDSHISGLDLNIFLDECEQYERHPMFTMKFEKLKDSDLDGMLRMIVMMG